MLQCCNSQKFLNIYNDEIVWNINFKSADKRQFLLVLQYIIFSEKMLVSHNDDVDHFFNPLSRGSSFIL